MDEALAKPESRAVVIKAMGGNTPADKINDGDIQFFLADLVALPLQYGHRTEMCDTWHEMKDKPFLDQWYTLMTVA